MKVKIKYEDPKLELKKGSEGASCYDLKSNIDFTLEIGQRAKIGTGISLHIEDGYEAQIRPRSGMSNKAIDVKLGTIDSDYRGEIAIIIHNNSSEVFKINRFDRIAQIAFCKVEETEFDFVEHLKKTLRGEGGFGHTGK